MSNFEQKVAAVAASACRVAVQVGELHDATGMSHEVASRWVKVVSDARVPFGVFLAVASQAGRGDAALLETFRLLARMPRRARRAAARAFLGDSWKGVARLVADVDALPAKLAAVPAARLFTAQNVADARAFSAALDDLRSAS